QEKDAETRALYAEADKKRLQKEVDRLTAENADLRRRCEQYLERLSCTDRAAAPAAAESAPAHGRGHHRPTGPLAARPPTAPRPPDENFINPPGTAGRADHCPRRYRAIAWYTNLRRAHQPR